jgi:hypothetical protein
MFDCAARFGRDRDMLRPDGSMRIEDEPIGSTAGYTPSADIERDSTTMLSTWAAIVVTADR